MYDRTDAARVARRQTDVLPRRDPAAAVRVALQRVRKTLTAFRPGVPFAAAPLHAAIAAATPQPETEIEHLFALGWLHWVDGDYTEADGLLSQALERARQANAAAQIAETAYWRARVRLRLDHADAVGDFETVLRQLAGSPQATAWFVDLLWRAGRGDRAEQIWKSVRGNKRVTSCPEGSVLEARALLRRGAVGGAVKVLVEAQPANGVVWVERLLLLAWAEVAQNRRDKALEFLRRIEELPYPRAALTRWQSAVEGLDTPPGSEAPALLRDLERGYQALMAGAPAAALEAFHAALVQPAALPFARYALARLGQDNFAELLAAQPGLFLAVRCRVWLELERFRQRQLSPGAWLETLQRDGRLGFVADRAVEHFRQLALILHQPPDAATLRLQVEASAGAEPAARRNVLRAALEVSAETAPVPMPASRAAVPAGVLETAWLLHQAARALLRADYVESLACIERARQSDPDWATVPNAALVRDAVPELTRRAHAQALAAALRPDASVPAIPPALLTDLVDLLRQHADGAAILDAAAHGEASAVNAALATLLTLPDLPPRLAHHLALVELRAAQALEDSEEIAAAAPHWRASWSAWLRVFAAPDEARLVFDWLFARQRRRINDLLARNAVDGARRHWALVLELPALAAGQSEALAADLSGRVERFREDLASTYLVTTREAMRYGAIPEGWHADYDKGLSHLRRLLSLDRDNVRLLTALVEICGEWFLDLYNAADHTRLTEQVARFVPFAQQLLRLTESRPGDLAARVALSQYFKFRGFVAADRAEKALLYRESLRLDPGNENVRALLQGLV